MNLQTQFQKYGQDTKIMYPDSTLSPEFKAFIQPLRYKNKMYLYGVNTEIGYNSQGYYLYIGPADMDLTQNLSATLISMGIKYTIDRSERIIFEGKTVYIWAIIRTVIEN